MEQLPSLHDKAGLEQAGFSSGSEIGRERFLHLVALLNCQDGDKEREKEKHVFYVKFMLFLQQ